MLKGHINKDDIFVNQGDSCGVTVASPAVVDDDDNVVFMMMMLVVLLMLLLL